MLKGVSKSVKPAYKAPGSHLQIAPLWPPLWLNKFLDKFFFFRAQNSVNESGTQDGQPRGHFDFLAGPWYTVGQCFRPGIICNKQGWKFLPLQDRKSS